jgi:ATP-dependent protease ClpP protease subunit
MGAEQAKEYGLIDEIINRRKDGGDGIAFG